MTSPEDFLIIIYLLIFVALARVNYSTSNWLSILIARFSSGNINYNQVKDEQSAFKRIHYLFNVIFVLVAAVLFWQAFAFYSDDEIGFFYYFCSK